MRSESPQIHNTAPNLQRINMKKDSLTVSMPLTTVKVKESKSQETSSRFFLQPCQMGHLGNPQKLLLFLKYFQQLNLNCQPIMTSSVALNI